MILLVRKAILIFLLSGNAMSANISVVYKSFLIIQDDNSRWIVPMLPNRTPHGTPISQGPFSTIGIAQHAIDIALGL